MVWNSHKGDQSLQGDFLDKLGLLKVSQKPESHPTDMKTSTIVHILQIFNHNVK